MSSWHYTFSQTCLQVFEVQVFASKSKSSLNYLGPSLKSLGPSFKSLGPSLKSLRSKTSQVSSFWGPSQVSSCDRISLIFKWIIQCALRTNLAGSLEICSLVNWTSLLCLGLVLGGDFFSLKLGGKICFCLSICSFHQISKFFQYFCYIITVFRTKNW